MNSYSQNQNIVSFFTRTGIDLTKSITETNNQVLIDIAVTEALLSILQFVQDDLKLNNCIKYRLTEDSEYSLSDKQVDIK
jgi:hypothetical protein